RDPAWCRPICINYEERCPMIPQPSPRERGVVLAVLIRFVSCGLLSVTSGLAWRLSLAPQRIGPGSALAGILFLLLGFVVGGVLWYLRDVRRRARSPETMTDERIIFSFIVFVIVPALVGAFVALVWVIALII